MASNNSNRIPNPKLFIRTFATCTRVFVVTAAVAITIQTLLFELHFVEGASMSPSLSPDYHTTGKKDLILVRKLGVWSEIMGARSELKRGDIISFWRPHQPEHLGVKRVIGVEGDTVFRNLRRVGLERQQLDEGVRPASAALGLLPQPPIVKVPTNALWLEGDNWRDSLDSNDFGPMTKGLVDGRVIAVVWPPARWQLLGDHKVDDSKVRPEWKRKTAVREGKAHLPPEWADP